MSIQLPGRNMVAFSVEALRAIIEEHLRQNTTGSSLRVTNGPYFNDQSDRFEMYVTTGPEKTPE